MRLISCFVFITFCLLSHPSLAAVNDGKILFGGSASTTTPEAYSNSNGGDWTADTLTDAAESTIGVVRCAASPQSPEVICGVMTSTSTKLWVYRWDGSTWSQDWSDSAPTSATFINFDVTYEQDTGDALVVYSNGASTGGNELSYRARVDDVWDGSSSTINSSNTSGVIEYVKMEARPNSDEIALSFSDSNDDLSAFVWDGSTWGSEPSAALSTSLTTNNNRKFDLAYEQVSGDLIVVYNIAGTAGVGIARKAAGGTTWDDTNNEAVLADIAAVLDLTTQPGTNTIGFASISTAEDLQLAIWDGTDDTAPFAFTNVCNNIDTTTDTHAANLDMLTVGWANGRAVFAYGDAASTTALSYFTYHDGNFYWSGGNSTGNCASTNQTPFTSPAVFTAGRKNLVQSDQFSGSPDKVMFTVIDANSDLWTLTFDGTSDTTTWTVLDDGTGGDNALEGTTSRNTNWPADATLTSHDPTPVGLLSFSATTEEGGASIGWRTASEAYLSGFKLFRAEEGKLDPLEEVTEKRIRSKGSPLSGHIYYYNDKELKPGKRYSYLLEVIEKDGDPVRYGPVWLDQTSTFIGSRASEKEEGYLRRDGKRVLKTGVVEKRKKLYRLSKERLRGRYHFAPMKMEVKEDGIYRITGEELQAGGLNLSLVQPKRLKLFNQGKEIPIFLSGTEDGSFDASDFLEFYGRKMTGRYTATNVYWLKQFGKPGRRIQEVPSSETGIDILSYQKTYHLERNDAYYGEIIKGEERFFFEDELLSPASVTYTFPVKNLFVGGAEEAVLKVALQGLQPNLTKNFEQHVLLSVNGHPVGEVRWERDEPFRHEVSFPVSYLTEGENTVTLEVDDDIPEPPQIVLIDWIEIGYPRAFVVEEGTLSFTVTSPKGVYRIEGFSTPALEILAVGELGTSRITEYRTELGAEGYVLVFGGNFSPGTRLVVFEEGALKKPVDTLPDQLSSLKARHNAADYLIITHRDFEEVIQELADYRASQGLKVKVVNVEDIYDEFSDGLFTPLAIRDFLRYTHANWKVKPQYLLLVGDGTFDYQDFFGMETPNYVPAYFVASPDFGEAPSDTWFGDVEDEDGVSEIAVGRLAVQDPSQLAAVIAKIKSYESSPPTDEAFFVADAGETFLNHSKRLAETLPSSVSKTTLSLDELSAEEVRNGLLEGLNSGVDLLNYVGHGAIIFWSPQDILNTGDIVSLSNSTYPLMVSSSCLSSYFVYPGNELDSLSEVFLNAEAKGIVASLGPTALSSPTEQQIFAEAFYQAMLTEETLGKAHLEAQRVLKKKGSPSRAKNVNRTFLLLGDPVLKFPR